MADTVAVNLDEAGGGKWIESMNVPVPANSPRNLRGDDA
jgi:hypothetical protein